MFQITQDDEVFKQFWADEKWNSPQHFQDATQAWRCSQADFLDFCHRATVYLVNDNILVYAESTGEVHLSVLRHTDTSNLISELTEVRNELFKTFELLFAWVGTHHGGMKRIMSNIGFSYRGFSMVKGQSHGKVLNWHCYMLLRKEMFCNKPQSLLNFS